MTSDLSLEVVRITPHPMSAPISMPRRNAFGVMRERPALFVEVQLNDGSIGWGEAFCNWPSFANQHRSRLIAEVLAPLIKGHAFPTPRRAWQHMTDATHALAIQCGEPGPFASAIAGIEIAVWDALARRQNRPLWAMFAEKNQSVRVYASGLSDQTIDALVPDLLEHEWQAFKLKIGFGQERDEKAVRRLRDMVGSRASVMVDANQAWDKEQAAKATSWLERYDVTWLEEPLPADSPMEDWHWLARRSPVALAAGENHRGLKAYQELADSGVAYLQPDLIKWGGLDGVHQVAALAQSERAHFAPHFLGGGIGLAATLHLCSVTQADWLEVDVTENPLRNNLRGMRELFGGPLADGCVTPSHSIGHGVSL